jgi:hypothetical protein
LVSTSMPSISSCHHRVLPEGYAKEGRVGIQGVLSLLYRRGKEKGTF